MTTATRYSKRLDADTFVKHYHVVLPGFLIDNAALPMDKNTKFEAWAEVLEDWNEMCELHNLSVPNRFGDTACTLCGMPVWSKYWMRAGVHGSDVDTLAHIGYRETIMVSLLEPPVEEPPVVPHEHSDLPQYGKYVPNPFKVPEIVDARAIVAEFLPGAPSMPGRARAGVNLPLMDRCDITPPLWDMSSEGWVTLGEVPD